MLKKKNDPAVPAANKTSLNKLLHKFEGTVNKLGFYSNIEKEHRFLVSPISNKLKFKATICWKMKTRLADQQP